MESDLRFYRRRANEEMKAADRAITQAARERRMLLAGIFLDRLKELESRSAFDWADEKQAWPGLLSIGIAESTRQIGERTSIETRYYLTAIPTGPAHSARRFARAVRYHWGIENSLHWTLDVAFNEDACRVRKDHGPQNLAVIRHICLNLLKRDETTKAGIKARRLKAGWDNTYLEHLLIN